MRKTVSPPIVYLDLDDDENENSPFQSRIDSFNKNSIPSENFLLTIDKKRKYDDQTIESNRFYLNEHKRTCSQSSSISRFVKSTIDEQQVVHNFDHRSVSNGFPWPHIPTQIPRFEQSTPQANSISLRIPSDDQPSAFRRVSPKQMGQSHPENIQSPLPLPFPQRVDNRIVTRTGKKRASPSVQKKKPPETSMTVNQSDALSNLPTQNINELGVFAAFHDSKYFRCNICKFKSTNSSILLQHMFTHVFICEKCDFFSFSQYQLNLHLFDKHQVLGTDGDVTRNLQPKSFDLLYLNRYKDGSFSICSTRPLTKIDRAPVEQVKKNSGKQNTKTQKINKKRSKTQTQHSAIRFYRELNVCYVFKSANKEFSFTFEFNRCQNEIHESLLNLDHAQRTKAVSPTSSIFQVFRNFINDNENERKLSQQDFEDYFRALKLSAKYLIRTSDHKPCNSRDYQTILTAHSNETDERRIIASINQSVLTFDDEACTQTLVLSNDNRHLFLSKHQISTKSTSKTTNSEISSIPKRRPNEKYLSNQRNNSTDQSINVIVID